MSKKHGAAFPAFQLKVCCEAYFAQCLYLQAREWVTAWRTQPWVVVMDVRPNPQNSRARSDGKSCILRQHVAAECERWHPQERVLPAGGRRRCAPARSAECSVAEPLAAQDLAPLAVR